MKNKIITVADVIEFFKNIPPDTEIRVRQECTANYSTGTEELVEIIQYTGFDRIDGITYDKETKTVDFRIKTVDFRI
jgi:hypothetical protein